MQLSEVVANVEEGGVQSGEEVLRGRLVLIRKLDASLVGILGTPLGSARPGGGALGTQQGGGLLL